MKKNIQISHIKITGNEIPYFKEKETKQKKKLNERCLMRKFLGLSKYLYHFIIACAHLRSRILNSVTSQARLDEYWKQDEMMLHHQSQTQLHTVT